MKTRARRHRYALLLPTGELARISSFVARQPNQGQYGLSLRGDLRLVHLAHLQREGDVLSDRHVREEGVVLENHADVATVRRHRRNRIFININFARGRDLEASQHHQRRRLAGTRRSQERNELARSDVERDVIDGGNGAVAFFDAIKKDASANRSNGVGTRSALLSLRLRLAENPTLISEPPRRSVHYL